MAEEGSKPNGTSYGQVIADGQSTVTFASAFVDLVGRPLSGLWSKHSVATEYRAKLGEWAAEAVDGQGRWLQPVLRTAAFEEHLVNEEGHPKPEGHCESSLAWAQLLYALNIRPGKGVLAWKVPSKTIDPTIQVASLLVEGPAMCHIINLFRLYKDSAPISLSPDGIRRTTRGSRVERDMCHFSFGAISVDEAPVEHSRGSKFLATFEPGSREDLAQQRVPFSYSAWFLSGTCLRFEHSSLMAKYFNGVHNQIPMTDAVGLGALPAPDESLKRRAEYYVQSSKLPASLHECDPKCELSCTSLRNGHNPCTESCQRTCSQKGSVDWQRPRVVTSVWLDDIERIKRRLTANGGDDEGLLDFLMCLLAERPQYVQEVRGTILACGHPKSAEGDAWKSMIRRALKDRFLFTNQHIFLYWASSSKSLVHLHDRLDRMLLRELPDILANLAGSPDGGWLHQLSGVTEELEQIVGQKDNYHNVPVVVLELGPSHPFWSGSFEISGE